MDNVRFILILAISAVSMLLWQKWQIDYGADRSPEQPVTTEQGALPIQPEQEDVPVAPVPGNEEVKQARPAIIEATTQSAGYVHVQTDTVIIKINLSGGGINHAELRNYPVSVDMPDNNIVILDDALTVPYLTQGGLLSNQSAPTHEAIFNSVLEQYVLAEGDDVLLVPLTWESGDGIKVTKTYEFRRGSYEIKLRHQVENNSPDVWLGRSYSQLKRSDAGSSMRRIVYTYTGAVISSPEKRYEKIDFDDMREQKLEQDIANGWIAMLQHYFVVAVLPGSKADTYRYYTKALSGDMFVAGAISPAISIGPDETGVLEDRLYIGPKLQDVLEETAEGLELTVDYGWLWFIAKPLFSCLSWLYDKTGNWGWAIILVTILLKALFYPLSAAGFRSMANMRRVQPRIISIKERYKNDKTAFNQAMMQIYKEEKINPLGGCFPILIQIPVFIALYWVLLESVEMRQASFILWLDDLSSPDPFFVLPVLMGVTMFVQQKLNPAPMDPVQEKVMSFLPLIFTVFFAFFPSGLVLYWVVNNMLSIAQQWAINRNLERAGLSTKPAKPS